MQNIKEAKFSAAIAVSLVIKTVKKLQTVIKSINKSEQNLCFFLKYKKSED